MLEKIKNKGAKQHVLLKVFFVIWLGFATGALLNGGKRWITLSNNPNVQLIECKYIETVANIGFPDKRPNLIDFDMQKFIGGKRILVNKFTYTLSQGAVLKYYDAAFVKNGWEKIPTTDGESRYVKEGVEYFIRFLPNNVYEVRVSMINQK